MSPVAEYMRERAQIQLKQLNVHTTLFTFKTNDCLNRLQKIGN